MFYLVRGAPLNALRLIGSPDGIHWDAKSDTVISRIASDHPNTIVYDPRAGGMRCFRGRSKFTARASGQGVTDSGESRRGIARMTSRDLWTRWSTIRRRS